MTALTREALAAALHADISTCLFPYGAGTDREADHRAHLGQADTILAALGTPPPARPEAGDGDAQHYRSPDGVHLGALRKAKAESCTCFSGAPENADFSLDTTPLGEHASWCALAGDKAEAPE